ncbi:MAG TPA: hypothetical protein VNU46_08285 [Gemmatimonadaceae bacterium]|jgi:hypothetical protein|nr:hypothetical protein [Gemmatimonadaceae bacterium]
MTRCFPHVSTARAAICGALLLAGGACTPPLSPLTGISPVNATLPAVALVTGQRKVVFTWELEANSLVARGNGAARLSAPDSARVDLFLTGGFGGASAVLIGDSLIVPPGAGTRGIMNMIPPTPVLWAALGRLALPALADTIIRVSGDTLRADVGRPRQWRVTAVRDQLILLDHISGDRIIESVERMPDGGVRYHSSDHRSLVLHIQQDQPMAAFDASIWHF